MNKYAPLSILLTSSEVVGFSKTGGLADVSGSLPQAITRLGHRCEVITPLYRSARRAHPHPEPTSHQFHVVVGSRVVESRLWRSCLPDGKTPVWLVEQDDYFGRDDASQGRGLYGYTTADGTRRDYEDNCERFVFFNRAVLEVLPLIQLWPDVLHVNDWQTGLIPIYLAEHYRHRRDESHPLAWHDITTLLTLHNIAFQGVFGYRDMHLSGLDWRLFSTRQLEYHGQLSFLKAGILFADLLSTVSPTYASEIQTPHYGSGLEGVLVARRDRLHGIVNGVDYTIWDPHTDTHLPANYNAEHLEGKATCKAELQRELRLGVEPRTPLCGVVARLTEQKGVDLIAAIVPSLVDRGGQLALLGEGDPTYHTQFERLRERYPGRIGLHLGFDEGLAHRIEAGADFFLMPSAFEPSGLNQLYSLRYGTPPVVRATGGLADTVVDTTPRTLGDRTATGFRFQAHTVKACWGAIERALSLYRDDPLAWHQLQKNGMRQDWSWDRSAVEYLRLYEHLREMRREA